MISGILAWWLISGPSWQKHTGDGRDRSISHPRMPIKFANLQPFAPILATHEKRPARVDITSIFLSSIQFLAICHFNQFHNHFYTLLPGALNRTRLPLFICLYAYNLDVNHLNHLIPKLFGIANCKSHVAIRHSPVFPIIAEHRRKASPC